MAGDDAPTRGYSRGIPAGIVAVGTSIVLIQVAVLLLYRGVAGLFTISSVVSVLLVSLFALPVVGGGLWLHRSDVGPDRYPRVAGWVLALLSVILAVNLVMIVTWPQPDMSQNVGWAVNAAQMGAAAGVTFGSIEARAIDRARTAERQRVRSEELEYQREWLDYLNGLLRHEVLNTANVVTGYAELALSEHVGDERTRDRLERIARQSQKMTDVIQDVRLLIQATNEGTEFETIDLVPVLQQEVTALEDRFESVAVEVDLPERAPVEADDLVARIFSNVLSNAVEHNDADDPRVRLSVTVDPETVTVTIADNGPGVPEVEQRTLFERSGRGNHGIGLYLVGTLAGRYGGSVALTETGPEGSTFSIDLPRASAESLARNGSGAVASDPA